jgi:hypothetical protein
MTPSMSRSIDWDTIPNPKLAGRELSGRNSWYPFYPGFSPQFASWVLDALAKRSDYSLLDPWNGSGTTTALAACRGLSAIGVDLNPAMVVIAKARLLDPLDVASIQPLCREVLRAVPRHAREVDEPLSALLAHEGPRTVRGIERSIASILIDNHENTVENLCPERITPLAAFFYVALFRTCRTLLKGSCGTNPVWTRLRAKRQILPRPTASHVSDVFASEVHEMLTSEQGSRPTARHCSPSIEIRLADSADLPIPAGSIDLTVTSPPYCTRVDYAVAMLPELAVLGLRRDSSFDVLRRKLIGTTTVPNELDPIQNVWGKTCSAFLRAVEAHDSKASAGYYLKSHVRYFKSLFDSLSEIARVTSRNGKLVLVVQDSYYKNVHNDLPRIVVEMSAHLGLEHVASKHFPLKRLIAASNPRVRKYREQAVTAVESVIVLKSA